MDKYILEKKIGAGSYGSVYVVRSKIDRKQYVLKRVNMNGMSTKERMAAKQEVALLQSMQHPSIVAYRDSFLDNKDRDLCIVMTLCEGGDIATRIKQTRGKYFTEDQIMTWFVQTALALDFIHNRRILHRDLKTQNIFLMKDGMVKLGDFGIAKVLDKTLDMAKTSIGTPLYMAPEVCNNKPYNFKSDIWSLGCVLYEMAALRTAFDARDLNSLFLKILRGVYSPLPYHYSSAFSDLIRRMLNKSPKARPTISEILKLPYVKKKVIEWVQSKYSSFFSKGDVKDLDDGFIRRLREDERIEGTNLRLQLEDLGISLSSSASSPAHSAKDASCSNSNSGSSSNLVAPASDNIQVPVMRPVGRRYSDGPSAVPQLDPRHDPKAQAYANLRKDIMELKKKEAERIRVKEALEKLKSEQIWKKAEERRQRIKQLERAHKEKANELERLQEYKQKRAEELRLRARANRGAVHQQQHRNPPMGVHQQLADDSVNSNGPPGRRARISPKAHYAQAHVLPPRGYNDKPTEKKYLPNNGNNSNNDIRRRHHSDDEVNKNVKNHRIAHPVISRAASNSDISTGNEPSAGSAVRAVNQAGRKNSPVWEQKIQNIDKELEELMSLDRERDRELMSASSNKAASPQQPVLLHMHPEPQPPIVLVVRAHEDEREILVGGAAVKLPRRISTNNNGMNSNDTIIPSAGQSRHPQHGPVAEELSHKDRILLEKQMKQREEEERLKQQLMQARMEVHQQKSLAKEREYKQFHAAAPIGRYYRNALDAQPSRSGSCYSNDDVPNQLKAQPSSSNYNPSTREREREHSRPVSDDDAESDSDASLIAEYEKALEQQTQHIEFLKKSIRAEMGNIDEFNRMSLSDEESASSIHDEVGYRGVVSADNWADDDSEDNDGEDDVEDISNGRLSERIEILRQKCERLLGKELFERVYLYVKNSKNLVNYNIHNDDHALDAHLITVMGPEKVQYWHLVDELVFCENSLYDDE